MKKIEDFLCSYWKKYPEEQDEDLSIEEIHTLINMGAYYYLASSFFILYEEEEECINVICYWGDFWNVSRSTLLRSLREHKSFIKKQNKPVYSEYLKPLFKRNQLGIQEDNKWRWI